MAGYGDIFSSGGGALASLFGSDDAPKAVLNRFAAPTAKASGALSSGLLNDVNSLSKNALDQYLSYQPKMGALVGQQEGVLNSILNRRLGADPVGLLRDVGNTAFGFIDPNVLNPLAAYDVNADALMRRARGLNPAAVDSTADRLRRSRIASDRYYTAARDAYASLPNLYGQAFNQGALNDNAAAGLLPQIAASYEGLATRPVTGLMQRIGTAGAANQVGGQGIQNILNSTQGYKQPQNFFDRLGAASQDIGNMVNGIAGVAGGAAGGGGSM